MSPHDPRAARRRRDLTALALIAAGAVGLLTAAFCVHPLLGWAAVSATAIAAGALLGSGQ